MDEKLLQIIQDQVQIIASQSQQIAYLVSQLESGTPTLSESVVPESEKQVNEEILAMLSNVDISGGDADQSL